MNLVTIKFPDSGGNRVGTCNLPWVDGKSLKQYFHEPVLKQEGIVARALRCHIYRETENLKVRMSYVPKVGETLTLVFAGRGMS